MDPSNSVQQTPPAVLDLVLATQKYSILQSKVKILAEQVLDPDLIKVRSNKLKELILLVTPQVRQNREIENALKVFIKTLADKEKIEYPQELIKLTCGEKEIKIPAKILISQSDFFAAALATKMREGSEGRINLLSSVVETLPESGQTFLNCLESATSGDHISIDNFMPLLLLSQEYQVNWLYQACLVFLEQNINIDNVVNFLNNLAIPNQQVDFTQLCIKFIHKNWDNLLSKQAFLKILAKTANLVDLSLIAHWAEFSNECRLGWNDKEFVINVTGHPLKVNGYPPEYLLELMGGASNKWYQPPIKMIVTSLPKDKFSNFLEFLNMNQRIDSLNLGFNSGQKIGDSEAKLLAHMIVLNKKLTNLALSANVIGDEGAIALAKAFKERKSPISLNLNSNKISEVGIEAFAQVGAKDLVEMLRISLLIV